MKTIIEYFQEKVCATHTIHDIINNLEKEDVIEIILEYDYFQWLIKEDMFNLHRFILEYWDIKKGKDQKRGSTSDIYAERSINGFSYFMVIDDGNCEHETNGTMYHIYAGSFDDKIFEGRIASCIDFVSVMKMLGIERKTNKQQQ